MKEYVVLKINCHSGLTMREIFAHINEKVVSHSNFFAIQSLRFDVLDVKSQNLFRKIGLDGFSYKVVLPHLKETPTYNSERDDRRMISNLDRCWEWNNETCHDSLSEEKFSELITFCDRLHATDIATVILGLDEIEWGGQKVGKGSYGYQRADCTYRFGENYLSNSITVGRDYSSKNYTVCLSCEKRFSALPIIAEMAGFLGNVKEELTAFAPETEHEREEWEKAAGEAKQKLEDALACLKKLPLLPIEKWKRADESEKIYIKKHIKQYLCTDGWRLQKALPDEWPTIVCREKQDRSIKLSISSGHNGHHLQALLYYRSPMYKFGEHIPELSYNEISDADVEKYFVNAVTIRNYLDEML